MSDPVAQFDKLHADVEVLFLVCMQIALSLVAGALEMLTNYIYRTVTAEAASLLPAMRTASGYTGETIVDPDNFLAKELKRRGLLDVAISDKNAYPNGMAQPAVLVLRRDGTVLYQWAIVPGFTNFGGAKDRPSLKEIWENIESQLKGGPPVHRRPSTMGAMGVLKQKVLG